MDDPTERFAFGANWKEFLGSLDDQRIAEAVASLSTMLGAEAVVGRTFLDIGSGSGLFSLAAIKAGAERVLSIDFDQQSVECAFYLRERFNIAPDKWVIRQGSVLDQTFMGGLGSWDIVYSWGVLHHTGHLWEALEAAIARVSRSGVLFIALYNDQGLWSKWWTSIKGRYVRSGPVGRQAILFGFIAWSEIKSLGGRMLRGEPLSPSRVWSEYRRNRGMSRFYDYRDWIGGYPFEVSKPEAVFDFCRARGFTLERMKTYGGGLGCNEFVFHAQGAGGFKSLETRRTN